MPVILATQEAEIRRIAVQRQGRLYLENSHHTKRAGGVAQGVDPDPSTIGKKKAS
jgi:hypothetical protein